MPLTVYWGCTIDSRYPNVKKALRETLDVAGIEYRESSANRCCGLPLFLSGNLEEASKQANRVIGQFADVGTVVTPCAGCFATLTQRYPDNLGLTLPFKTLHTTGLIAGLISDGRLRLKGNGRSTVVFHDPCELGRRCGIYEEPRRVLRSIPELRLAEPKFVGERANCCGGGGLLPSSFPEMAIELASLRISKDILPAKPDVLVTSCPSCYLNFSRAIERAGYDLRLLDIVEIVSEHLG